MQEGIPVLFGRRGCFCFLVPPSLSGPGLCLQRGRGDQKAGAMKSRHGGFGGLTARGAVVVVEAAECGPVVHRFPSMGYAAAWFLAVARYGCALKTETAWIKSGAAWLPAFPWQHG